MINFHQVHKAYRVSGQDIPALQPSDLQIARGEVFGIIGHSGAGKSTLLRLINRLEQPSGGRIEIDSEDVTALDATGLRRLDIRSRCIRTLLMKLYLCRRSTPLR